MAYQTGTVTDYVDLLNELVDFLTSQGVATVAVNAGGGSYVVGDVLTASGGTSTHAATFEVTSVGGGGDVTGIIVLEHGAYTSTPGNPVSTTGGTGTGCTLDLTWQDTGWSILRETQEAVSATPAAGGTGYQVGDQLSLVGGVEVAETAVFNVDSVGGGGDVTGVSLVTDGSYGETPANAVSTTGGNGSNCTLNVTWQDLDDEDKQVILEGEGSGADQIFVGIRSFSSAPIYNWELAGMTGFDSGLIFGNQPGISPGRWDAGPVADQCGAYVPLNNSTMTYWFFADGRRFIVIAKIGAVYANLHVGFIDPFSISADYPYPLLILGCSSDPMKPYNDTSIGYSGMTEPISADGYEVGGPGWLREPGGTWTMVRCSKQTTPTGRLDPDPEDVVIYPTGQIDRANLDEEDLFYYTEWTPDDLVPYAGIPGSPDVEYWQTPETPDFITPIYPATLYKSGTQMQVFGEMADVFWMSTFTETTNIVTEDTVTINGDVYLVFQNCNRNDAWAHFCIKRS
jgi:hypothetical protein